MLEQLKAIVGDANVLTAAYMAKYSHDWMNTESWTPLAVVRPASTEEVSAVVKLASANKTAVVPVSGNTGLCVGTSA